MAEQEAVPKQQESGTNEPVASPACVPDDGTPIVLVTGASGYIASHVIKNLLEEGKYRVRGTVRDATNEKKTKPIRELVPNAAKPIELVSADLSSEGSWEDAVKGCTYVLHLASPFPLNKPKNEDVLIRPAVEGTLNVLKACAAEVERKGPLKRVVQMSSIAAVSSGMGGDSTKVHTEEDWSDEAKCPPYEKSKYKAERAGWDFMEKLEENKKFEFSVVCPAAVLGPILNSAAGSSSSVAIILQILTNKMPGVPNINFPIIDIRDVAKGTIAAMEKPEAANRRYLLANEQSVPCRDIATLVGDEFIPQGYKVPTKPINRALLWVASFVNSDAKLIRSLEGTEMKYNNSRMTGELGVTPYPTKDTVLDTCYSLIENGVVVKTPKYLGHPDTRPPPEEPKPEEPKSEEPKPEEPKSEEPKPEEPKPEEPKPEEPKPEEPKPEEPKAEEPKPEEPKPEEPKPEEPKPEEPKPEEPKPEEPPTEATKEESPPEEPKEEETTTEEPKEEETTAEEPKEEETTAEEPKEEETTPEEPKEEETTAEEPKEEETTAEEPKEEETTPEEPKEEETTPEEPKEEESTPGEPQEDL